MFALIFLTIISGFFLGTLLWFVLSWRALAEAPTPFRRVLRGVLVFFVLLMMGSLWVHIIGRMNRWDLGVPSSLLVPVYLWFLMVMPAALVFFALAKGGLLLKRVVTKAPVPDNTEAPIDGSRRVFLKTAIATVPPVMLLASTGAGYADARRFRINRKELFFEELPAAFDGFRIAHLSDTHSGKFTDDSVMRKLAEATGALDPDLVVITGDLVDHTPTTLPAVFDLVRVAGGRHRALVCEGNHDLFEGREAFEGAFADAPCRLLINEGETIAIGDAKLRFVGLRWGIPGLGRGSAVPQNVDLAAKEIDPDAFNILLAHHPHAFDQAQAHGFNLTLAGHTHGGQMNLLPNVGFGPLMFRYWSGVYTKGAAKLVVSNGSGAWFPLRVNAPAEIIEITLRRGSRR